jgi:hypothetical protein
MEERLKRRLEGYRQRHQEILPRFQQSNTFKHEEEKGQTLILRHKFEESKNKKKSSGKQKAPSKKQNGSSQNVRLLISPLRIFSNY